MVIASLAMPSDQQTSLRLKPTATQTLQRQQAAQQARIKQQQEMAIKQQQAAEQYGLTPEHGVESYADFHTSRLVYHHIFNRLVIVSSF